MEGVRRIADLISAVMRSQSLGVRQLLCSSDLRVCTQNSVASLTRSDGQQTRPSNRVLSAPSAPFSWRHPPGNGPLIPAQAATAGPGQTDFLPENATVSVLVTSSLENGKVRRQGYLSLTREGGKYTVSREDED